MKIKRYDMYGLGGGRYTMNEHPTGAFVRYAEHAEVDLQLEESRREFRAADATINNLELKITDMAVQLANAESKCRELAAENAGLKELIEQHANSVAVCPNCSHEEPSETDDIVALYRSMETPATDVFLAEVRAQGVEMLADELLCPDLDSSIRDFAAQLRKGAEL